MTYTDHPNGSARTTARRLGAMGLLLAIACLAGGWALEIARFGWTDRAGTQKVERAVRQQLDSMIDSLSSVTSAVTARPELVRQGPGDSEVTRQLFELLVQSVEHLAPGQVAATVYGMAGVPLAWTGRPAEIPSERIAGPDAHFVVPSPLGLRLFHVTPIVDETDSRVGTVAAERALSPPLDVAALTDEQFRLESSPVPVVVRTRYEGAGEPTGPDRFLVRSPRGEPLLEVEVAVAALASARANWRRGVLGVALGTIALTFLLLTGPMLDDRRRAQTRRLYLRETMAAVVLILASRATLWIATPDDRLGSELLTTDGFLFSVFAPFLRSPLDFLATAVMFLAIVAVMAPPVALVRLRARRGPAFPTGTTLALQLAAGVGLAVLIVGHQVFLHETVNNTSVNVLRFSLYSWDPARLALVTGLVVFTIGNLWACTLLLIAAASFVRVPRGDWGGFAGLGVVWLGPAALALAMARAFAWPVPWLAVVLQALAVVLAARWARRALAWYRHAPLASRLAAGSALLVLPGLLLYPGVVYHTDWAKQRLIENDLAPQPAEHPQMLLSALQRSLGQIDAVPDLADLVAAGTVPTGAAPTESAFLLWSQTELAEQRLTSAIELYGSEGRLVGRFALNLPEYTSVPQQYRAPGCGWEVFGEAAPFGSEERRILHAERGICVPVVPESRLMRVVGTIVVHVMLDYSALPFLSSQSLYLEWLRGATAPLDQATQGADVELVIYGWGQSPTYSSGPSAWALDETVFDRTYHSREPFWATLWKDGRQHRVFFSNDRYGIYALGYPTHTVWSHLENLAEAVLLLAALYVLLLTGGAIYARLARSRIRLGRMLFREIRASFYRKLVLAFVLASVVPVLTLAFVTRTYFAAKLRADVEAEATRAATVAQRVIEEFAALQQSGSETFAGLNDDLMVLISQVINQDVNVFEGPSLVATSERDLFASGLLAQRTPDQVYRAIRLQRLPTFVGEDAIADVRYMLAAAPLRVAGHDAVLTVPQTLRQREIEREIDDLTRGITMAALLFIVLGGTIGLSMAERIADPVRRLTRATRQVARGDFDARILVRSADELQRLVEAFNTMAAELKTQAVQLQRTHRLEAWAEMARQVAHEIKNPLTPIQLSAEHLRRVHADRGEPLSPVLDSCVDSILNQVRLLRQISGEFSAFAAVPAPEPKPVVASDLIEEIIGPYRPGLGERIELILDLPSDLPSIWVDRTLVGRALVNIIENAINAIPSSGTIRFRVAAEDQGVALEVSDTGVGMDPEALERVFEPYFSTRTFGTGLGLTIAKRNIESSGGRIDVASERGKGTVVRLWLPATSNAD